MLLFKQEKYDSPRQVFFKSYEMFKYDVTWRKNTQCNVKIFLHNEYVFHILKQTRHYRKYNAPKFSRSRLDQNEMFIFIKKDKY